MNSLNNNKKKFIFLSCTAVLVKEEYTVVHYSSSILGTPRTKSQQPNTQEFVTKLELSCKYVIIKNH